MLYTRATLQEEAQGNYLDLGVELFIGSVNCILPAPDSTQGTGSAWYRLIYKKNECHPTCRSGCVG